MKSIIQNSNDRRCYECKRTNVKLEVHHCIHGIRRKQADKDGLTVYLCQECHKRLHSVGSNLNLKYKQIAQRAYMDKFKIDEDEFIKIYLQNYL